MVHYICFYWHKLIGKLIYSVRSCYNGYPWEDGEGNGFWGTNDILLLDLGAIYNGMFPSWKFYSAVNLICIFPYN